MRTFEANDARPVGQRNQARKILTIVLEFWLLLILIHHETHAANDLGLEGFEEEPALESSAKCEFIGFPFVRWRESECPGTGPVWEWSGLIAAMSANGTNPVSNVQGTITVARTSSNQYQSLDIEFNRQSSVALRNSAGLPVSENDGLSDSTLDDTRISAESVEGRSGVSFITGWKATHIDFGIEIGQFQNKIRSVHKYNHARLFLGKETKFATRDTIRLRVGYGVRETLLMSDDQPKREEFASLSLYYGTKLGRSTDFMIGASYEVSSDNQYFSDVGIELSFWISDLMAISMRSYVREYGGFDMDIDPFSDNTATTTTLGLLVRR